VKVFGIGLARTGNLSLATALRILGLETVHFPQSWGDFETHEAATDSPVALSYRSLDMYFPGAKFVLTTRPKEKWLPSMKWLFDRRPVEAMADPTSVRSRKLRVALYGSATYDERTLSDAYDRHHLGVLEWFSARPTDLLVLRTGVDGWDQLCRFLDRPAPAQAYPTENRRSL